MDLLCYDELGSQVVQVLFEMCWEVVILTWAYLDLGGFRVVIEVGLGGQVLGSVPKCV